MTTHKVAGWLRDEDMPPLVAHARGPVKLFSSVHSAFSATAASAAGTDYDIPEPPCYNQGPIGSCVLNAVCGAVNILLLNEGNSTTDLSRLFLYWLCREAMGSTAVDSGTYPHLAVERAGNIGMCSEKVWQYGEANLYVPPSPECYPEASDNKATAWFSLDGRGEDRLNQMEMAIRANHPVVYGSPVSDALQHYQPGQVLTVPDQNHLIGGHSTVFTGVRYLNGKRVWRVRNSWGADWGDAGHFLMDDAWAKWPGLSDLWVLTRMDSLQF